MSDVSGSTARNVADVLGVAGSALCAVHCMIVPVALLVGVSSPIALVDDAVFHRVMLWVVVPVALFAFTSGCLQHRDRRVLWMGAVGLASLVVSFTVLHDWIGEDGERVGATLAAALLIAAHVRNYRLCRAGACAHGDPA